MRIGQLAERTGVSTKTIRYYESIDLLPTPARTPSGYRDYGTESVERLRFVRDAQATGLSLAEISSVLEIKDAGSGSCAHTRDLLERHLGELDDQIALLVAARKELAGMADRASHLDPASCTDPNRCQVISTAAEAVLESS
ncbi:MAG: heavy metal-responsive transcriptional regulator [Acidimicrobiales bacterium]